MIGGGDFGEDRIISALVLAEAMGTPLAAHQPDATRPFRHVLDVILGYLTYTERLASGDVSLALNFGPRDGEIRRRGLPTLWGHEVEWHRTDEPVMDEARRVVLGWTLAGETLGWHPALDTPAATASGYTAWRAGEDMARATDAAVARALDGKALAT